MTSELFFARGDNDDTLQVEKFYRPGETIINQGDAGHCAYFIQEGRVEICVKLTDGVQLRVAERGAGSLIGEMAIVDGAPRSASVIALEECRLLEISRDDFSKAVANANPIVGLVTRLILMRYRDLLQRSETLREIAHESGELEKLELAEADNSRILATVRLTNEFRVAVARQQLYLKYQPFVELESGRVVGFEALMRWRHPQQGEMAPDNFIPMAEDTGLIVAATRWALAEACAALRRMMDACGRDDLFVSVNFSAQDFDDPVLLNTLMSVTAQYALPLSCIHIEITERLLLRQSQQVRDLLIQCRQRGMAISIDDFGTGYSSLSYLHRYPVTALKIDKSFIRDMCTDEGALGLVRTILSLSENMGLSIIAEGVETLQQMDILRTLKCQVAQGYLFARPLPEVDATELLMLTDQGGQQGHA